MIAKSGMGDINSLAQAFDNGEIHPKWEQGHTYQQSTPTGTITSNISPMDCVDLATANQIAGLLGGQVVYKFPYSFSVVGNPDTCPFIDFGGGRVINAASLAYYANVPSPHLPGLTADLGQGLVVDSYTQNYRDNGGGAYVPPTIDNNASYQLPASAVPVSTATKPVPVVIVPQTQQQVSNQTGSTAVTNTTNTTSTGAITGNSIFDSASNVLTQDLAVGGTQIPYWAIGLVGIGLAFMFMGRR